MNTMSIANFNTLTRSNIGVSIVKKWYHLKKREKRTLTGRGRRTGAGGEL